MKRELMRPEVDAVDYIQTTYWNAGWQGLLAGEALYLNIKRMELLAYHDNNKREFEITRHISLRQLAPMALLSLRTTGTCTLNVPEWFFDRECPGHYMRRADGGAVASIGSRSVHDGTVHLVAVAARRSGHRRSF